MTARQAQAASNPASAEHQDAAPTDATHAESASTGPSVEAQHQEAPITSTVQEQPSAALSQGETACGVTTANPRADGGGWGDGYDSLAGAEVLIIEDAAELTCDRAAVILRQLSCEREAAESYRELGSGSSTSVAVQEQEMHTPPYQAKADYPAAASSTDAESAGPLLLPGLLHNAGTVAGQADGQVSEPQGQLSTSGNLFDACGVKRDSGIVWPSPKGQSSSNGIQASSACLDAARLQAGSNALQTTSCPSMQLGPDQSAASTMQAASQQGAPCSSFLQRLLISKHTAGSGFHAAAEQSEERKHGEQPKFAALPSIIEPLIYRAVPPVVSSSYMSMTSHAARLLGPHFCDFVYALGFFCSAAACKY